MKTAREVAFQKLVVSNESATSPLKRVLGPFQLTLLGIGAMIGTGIFVMTGTAAVGSASRPGAGPAIVISFIITALACGLAAICYAEFAAMVPVSGSAYTYAYASFGELLAWIIGWDLLLEYAVGNVGVAIGWSEYMQTLLHFLGIDLPAWLSIDPMSVRAITAAPQNFTDAQVQLCTAALQSAPQIGFPIIFNLPAFLIVMAVTVLLIIGIRESARANAILVLVKFLLIGLFVWYGWQHVDYETNWQPFAPNGWRGVLTGSALIFFAYIGFDALSTCSEECRNPQRDVPIGMIASLIVCSILYVAVAAVLTGMVPLRDLNNAEPVAAALRAVGHPNVASIVSLGAVMSMAAVLLVLQFGQCRILFAMSRDGLLPRFLSRVDPRTSTPIWATIITGVVVGIPAALIDITIAADLCSIGTLFAFVLVAGGVLLLRFQQPDRERPFRVPFAIVVCPASMLICAGLMCGLPWETWIRFFLWMAIGLLIYFFTIVPRRIKESAIDA